MNSLQDIRRGNRLDGTEILHVADETNCTQWIHVASLKGDRVDIVYAHCEQHDEPHAWRRVWVQA